MRPRCSLLIPTYGRPQFVERLLRYYAACGVPWSVVVADSSPGAAAEATASALERHAARLRVRYERFAPETHVAEKIARATASIETDFAALCADDDFTVPASVQWGVEFLAAHPDYALAHGRAAYFVLAAGASTAGQIAGVGPYGQRAIDDATAAQRLWRHLTTYRTTFYSVHRTEQLRRIWAQAAALRLDYQFVELAPSCLSIIDGKSAQGRLLHLIRQGHAQQTSVRELPDALAWVAHPDWARQYQAVTDLLADAVASRDHLSLDVARALVRAAFARYLARPLGELGRMRPGSSGVHQTGWWRRARAGAGRRVRDRWIRAAFAREWARVERVLAEPAGDWPGALTAEGHAAVMAGSVR